TTAGTRFLQDFVPAADATAVRRLRGAGAILLGKTNCPEWGMFPYTRNELFGETHNPLGPVTVGGSSCGEAAAVASNMAALGVAVWEGPSSPAAREDVRAVVRDAARSLEGRGIHVADEPPDMLEEAGPLYSELRATDRLQDVRRLVRGREDLVGDDVRAAIAA